jgi:DNA-binding NtrC family response regulator
MSSPTFPWDAVVPARGSILLYGHYPTLLQTRRWILENAGFRAWTAAQQAEVEKILSAETIDLLILGHTLSAKDCERALAAAHRLRPRMKTLVLTENSSMYFGEVQDEAESTVDGPKGLIAIAQRMVPPASSAEPYPAQDVLGATRTAKKSNQ